MPNVKNNAAARETRRKLIEAGGELFAEKGLHATQIRDITDRAGVNVAAVNYHFGDKFGLYRAALKEAHSAGERAMAAVPSSGPPEDRLRDFIRALVQQIFNPDRPAWHYPLTWRARLEAEALPDELIDRTFRPLTDRLGEMIRELVPGASERTIALIETSIVGQCVFHLNDWATIRRVYAGVLDDVDPSALADHLANFSLAALRGLQDGAKRPMSSEGSRAPKRKTKRSRKPSRGQRPAGSKTPRGKTT